MKKQINLAIKAHLMRGAFYLLLFLAVCAIPFALAQRNGIKRGVPNPASNSNLTVSQFNADSQLLPYDVPGLARTSQFPRAASGGRAAPMVAIPRPPKAPQVTLYDQYDNPATTVTFCASIDIAGTSADLADDFVVPPGQTWNVESIDADGAYFSGAGPATDWNVFIFADSGGLPGTQVYSILNQPVTVFGTTFTVNLNPAAVLTAGTYWIEIQPNMTFATQGEWGWTDRTLQANNSAAWQNPGGAFHFCQTWTAKLSCPWPTPTPGGPDQVYRINGTIGAGTPTATPTASPSATATTTATPTVSATATPTASATATPTATPAGTPTATPTGSPACTPIVIQGSIDLSDPTQTDHLNRSGIAQTCPATTTCAIAGDALLHHYDSYTFTNSSGSTQCVTIDTNSTCTGVRFIFTAAYLGSFDPANICTNWIGDSGFSPNPDIAFQVDVDNGQTLVVVVSNVTATGTCPDYTLTVTGLCGGGFTPSPTPTPTATTSASATPTATATVTATPTATATPAGTPTATPTGSPSCTPVVINGSIDLSDPTQTDHLNRSGIPQTCPATTTCAIAGDGLEHHYDSYAFTNTSGSSQCVTIDTNTTCIAVRSIFTAAYLGTFDPNNICTNWIGDSGFSPLPDITFQVDVPAGETLVVVVSNVTAAGTCPAYTLTVTGLCGGFTPSPTPTATATTSASPTPTATATASTTATGTPTATPTSTVRPTPTPRTPPTPRPRPTPAPRP